MNDFIFIIVLNHFCKLRMEYILNNATIVVQYSKNTS